MPITNRKKIDEIQEIRYQLLNDWEQAFMNSVSKADANGEQLSDKQQKVLDSLYRRACASPY